MIIAVVGAGGKTTRIHALAARYRQLGKRVLVTTSTHMYLEPDTISGDHATPIIHALSRTGYAMAGVPAGEKIRSLPLPVYYEVCTHADVVLVEADGSKGRPIKFPNAAEPVIYDNVDEIHVVWGLQALNRPIAQAAHRPELACACLDVPPDTLLTPVYIQRLLREGYLTPLARRFPHMALSLHPTHDGSLYHRALSSLLKADLDAKLLCPAWFSPTACQSLSGGEGGMLCVVTDPSPRRVGAMMLVTHSRVLGCLGSDPLNTAAAEYARTLPHAGVETIVTGDEVYTILFLPVEQGGQP